MQSMRRYWVLACTALLLFLAGKFVAGSRADDRKEFEAVLVHKSCAPWDGPAVEIEFYSSPARCSEPQVSNLRVALWRDLPPKPGQKIDLGTDSKLGAASYCQEEYKCERAKSGSVLIESYEEGKGASGKYDFVFAKAGHLTGRFRASWCAMRIRCG